MLLRAMRLCPRRYCWRRFPRVILPTIFVFLFLQITLDYTGSAQTIEPRMTIKPEQQSMESYERQLFRVEDEPANVTEERVSLLRGHFRSKKGYLTVGLCTVPREGAYYLPTTLASLTSRLTKVEKESTVFVIYLGSQNKTWVKTILDMIDANFTEGVETGMIQVIQPDPQVYPDFSNIARRTYNDPKERVIWRTRQNVDFAYIFSHSREISKYYLHVEDDISAVPGYLSKINRIIARYEEIQKDWFCLEMTKVGFIGKVFHSRDLLKMKQFFLLFQFEKPGDLLINDMKSVMVQPKHLHSPVSLFKHLGEKSSLRNKTFVIRNNSDRVVIRRKPNLDHVKKTNLGQVKYVRTWYKDIKTNKTLSVIRIH